MINSNITPCLTSPHLGSHVGFIWGSRHFRVGALDTATTEKIFPEEKEMLERTSRETRGTESYQINHRMARETLCFKLVLT